MANHMEDNMQEYIWCGVVWCGPTREKRLVEKDSVYERRKWQEESTRPDAFGEKANHHPPIHNKFYIFIF